MSDVFIQLSLKNQSQILNTLATDLGKSALILEKDIWIVWALKTLFEMPNRYQMAFKGGTSLSKVYNLIHRFSEDVDITIDYSQFTNKDPLTEQISNTQIKKISEEIKCKVTTYLKDEILPYFRKSIDLKFTKNKPTIELDEKDGETLYLNYHSSLSSKSEYIPDRIRLEFGGRNKTTPQNLRTVCSDVSTFLPHVEFPNAEIIVLSPERTFWEKITLIHSECHRTTLKTDANRISRHWYDIIKMADNRIGITAMQNVGLLKDVIDLKNVFFRSSYSNYEDCLNGKIKLLPDDEYLGMLKDDFRSMLEEKMFYGEIPDFNLVFEKVEQLEKKLNDIILKS